MAYYRLQQRKEEERKMKSMESDLKELKSSFIENDESRKAKLVIQDEKIKGLKKYFSSFFFNQEIKS